MHIPRHMALDGWGASVEDGRLSSEEVADATLGPTVHGSVRLAADRVLL